MILAAAAYPVVLCILRILTEAPDEEATVGTLLADPLLAAGRTHEWLGTLTDVTPGAADGRENESHRSLLVQQHKTLQLMH